MLGLWVFGAAALGLNTWLVGTGRYHPLSRLTSAILTILVLVYVAAEWRVQLDPPIIKAGEFLAFLHIIKIYEQRSNRDYAQLLVLSLLLMVAAAISTASLLFGVIFIFYLFLSLYCCLLFHLKVEADEAQRGLSLPRKFNPQTFRQDQRVSIEFDAAADGAGFTIRNMRRRDCLPFHPGAGGGMLGIQLRPVQRLTGFSDQVNFQSVAESRKQRNRRRRQSLER